MLGLETAPKTHRIKTLVVRDRKMQHVLMDDGLELQGIVEGRAAGIAERGVVRIQLTLEYPIDQVRLHMDAGTAVTMKPADLAPLPSRLLDARGRVIGMGGGS